MRFKDRTIGILAAPGFDDFQVFSLVSKLKGRGAGVAVIGVGKDAALGLYGHSGSLIKPDYALDGIDARNLDALIVPSSPSQDDIIADEGVMTLLFGIGSQDKPVASTGNGMMVLAESGLLVNKRVASIGPGSEKLKEFGVNLVDQELVVDGNIITARLGEPLDHLVDVIAFLLEPAPSFS
ncbi:MAG: DJ-1/PfpI family protein [Thermoleophilia bacterium]